MHRNAQSSGTTIPAEVASALEGVWGQLLDGPHIEPTTTPAVPQLYEGAAYAVILTGYERDRQARQECIDYYGASCFVGGLDFGEKYGPPGARYIHVHHLSPLSENGESHEVVPTEDLRPVCPNCHVVIHRRSPPYTMEGMWQTLSRT